MMIDPKVLLRAWADKSTGICRDESRQEYVAIAEGKELGRCGFSVPEEARKQWESAVWQKYLQRVNYESIYPSAAPEGKSRSNYFHFPLDNLHRCSLL